MRRYFIWGILLIIIGGGFAENYRGHFLWKQYRKKWEAKGERFDLASHIPGPVTSNQNFASTPFFTPFFDYTIDPTDQKEPYHWNDKERFERHQDLAKDPKYLQSNETKAPEMGRWDAGIFTDLRAWQNYFDGNTNFPFIATPKDPASDVLTALRKYDLLLDEIRIASSRTQLRIPCPL